MSRPIHQQDRQHRTAIIAMNNLRESDIEGYTVVGKQNATIPHSALIEMFVSISVFIKVDPFCSDFSLGLKFCGTARLKGFITWSSSLIIPRPSSTKHMPGTPAFTMILCGTQLVGLPGYQCYDQCTFYVKLHSKKSSESTQEILLA